MIGEINKFKVLRETDIGYLLVKDDTEYFLHKNECLGKKLKDNEEVEAFLYFDNQKRLAATLATPIITNGKSGLLKVVDVNPNFGVFLYNGINKDLLLSIEEFGKDKTLYPEKDSYLYVTLRSGKNQLKAEIKKESFIKPQDLNIKDEFTGYVSLYVNDTFYLTNDKGETIRINKGCYNVKPKYGEKLAAIITYLGIGEVLGEISYDKDIFFDLKKEEILKILKKDQKEYTFDSFKDKYLTHLNLSGKQYKKIISILKSENKIDIKNGVIHLKENK